MNRIDDTLLAVTAQRVPPAYREVFLLKHRQNMTFQEISERLDLPEGTAKSRFYKAREKMLEILESAPEDSFWDEYLKELEDTPEARAIRYLRQVAKKREQARKNALTESDDKKPRSIDEFDFSVRLYNRFKAHGFEDVTDIQEVPTREFLKKRGLGRKPLEETIEVLEAEGYDPQFD